jgi:enoyl-CoA hydratase/carnithine racemase
VDATFPDLNVTIGDDYVATVEIDRPPHNYFDHKLIASLADAFTALDEDDGCRASVLCSNGKSFCAGANFTGPREAEPAPGALYREAVRLFSTRKPVVAAVQGAAIGGGLGVALFPDFRVASPEARFAANFARLGFHQGFGLTVTLPALVGQQMALDMVYTGRRVNGEEAFAKGLCDKLVPLDRVRDEAHTFAREIAISAPLAILSIHQTMRGDLADKVRAATDHELEEQDKLRKTEDFKEGIRATAERREPDFKGR